MSRPSRRRIPPMTELDKVRGVAMIVDREPAAGDSSTRRSQAFAFLSIFHPEFTLTERIRMANEISRAEGASDGE